MIVSIIWNTPKLYPSHLSPATAIFVDDCCQFGPSWIFGLWHGWGVIETVSEVFNIIDTIIWGQENSAFLRCTANQAGIDHKLQGKIGTNQQQKWLWQGWGVMEKFRTYLISLILSYKVRKKTALLHCTSNQSGTGHKLHFLPINPARAKLAPINNKNGCGTA